MARPKKNNADYFSHDADMRNDPKIKAVRKKFGLSGYAVWCMILETLTNSDGFKLDWDELSIELIAPDFDLDPDQLTDMVSYFCRLKLLSIDGGVLVCDKLIERFEGLLQKRNRQRKPETKRVLAVDNGVLDDDNPKVNDLSASKNPQSIVKESTAKETIPKENIKPPKSPKRESTPEKKTAYEESLDLVKQAFTEFFLKPPEELPECKKLWDLIIEHQELKKKKRSMYKSIRGAKGYFKELLQLSGNDFNKAEKIIEQSLDKEWVGLFEIKKQYNGKESNEEYQQRMYNFADQRTRENLNAIMANKGEGSGTGESSEQFGDGFDWKSLVD